jgi:hypothetical protein
MVFMFLNAVNTEELVNSVIKQALENLRQISFIPFWFVSHEVTPQKELRKLLTETRSNDRRVRQILEKAAERASRDSFEMQFRTESRNRFGHSVSDTIWIVPKEGYEWGDVLKDAWDGLENVNPWFLTDNALKILKWIQGPKNKGDFVSGKLIGSQACLLGTGSYSHIENYVKEICLKTPHHVKIEKTGEWQGRYKISLIDKIEDEDRYTHDNPVFPCRISKRDLDASSTYTRMIEDLVLKGEFPDDASCCILFEIHSRAELVRVLPAMANDESLTPYKLNKFLEDVRLPRGLRPAATLDDEASVGWLLGAALEEGWTWELAMESIHETRDRKDPAKTYGLSADAAKLLNWIWDLHDSEIQMGMTPCVESASRDRIGIKDLQYNQNSETTLQLLIDEINEKTSYQLRLMPWSHYSSKEHRILIRRKDDLDAQITRMIQIRGLEKNVALSEAQIGEALQCLWANGKPLI